jgi:proline iminopeptidase
MKSPMITAAVLISLSFCVLPVMRANDAAQAYTRDNATATIRNARKIVTANGVERLEKVRIGGIEQWVSVRGTDRRNPVVLYIHGGPGYVSIPMSWWFSRGWEEYFTIVQWDQRAAGKTHLANNPETVAKTLTRERMIVDAGRWPSGHAKNLERTRSSC